MSSVIDLAGLEIQITQRAEKRSSTALEFVRDAATGKDIDPAKLEQALQTAGMSFEDFKKRVERLSIIVEGRRAESRREKLSKEFGQLSEKHHTAGEKRGKEREKILERHRELAMKERAEESDLTNKINAEQRIVHEMHSLVDAETSKVVVAENDRFGDALQMDASAKHSAHPPNSGLHHEPMADGVRETGLAKVDQARKAILAEADGLL